MEVIAGCISRPMTVFSHFSIMYMYLYKIVHVGILYVTINRGLNLTLQIIYFLYPL